MSEVNLSNLDRVPKEINGMQIDLHSRPVLDLLVEIYQHHPLIVAEIMELQKLNNFERDIFYGAIAAYCGIVLDGTYKVDQLCIELLKHLVAKRAGITVISDNAVPAMRPSFESNIGGQNESVIVQ